MEGPFPSLIKSAKKPLESACIGVALQALRKRLQSFKALLLQLLSVALREAACWAAS